MITGISIKNFKAIGDPGISLDLEPITLLFGTNGAGKSSIFHAFLYAYEVLVNRNCDVDRTTLSGKNVDLGGFQSFVHDRDVTKPVVIEIELDLSSAQLDREWPLAEEFVGADENTIDVSDLATDCQTATIGFRIYSIGSPRRPIVTSFWVDLDDERVATFEHFADQLADSGMGDLESLEQSGQCWATINYRHPVFGWPTNSTYWDQESVGVFDYLYPNVHSHNDIKFWQHGEELPPFQGRKTKSNTNDKYKDYGKRLCDGELYERFGDFDPENIQDFSQYRFVLEKHNFQDEVCWIYHYHSKSKKVELIAGWFFLDEEANSFCNQAPQLAPGSEARQGAEKTWQAQKNQELNTELPIFIESSSLSNGVLPFFDQPVQLRVKYFPTDTDDEESPDDKDYDLEETRELLQKIVSRLTIGPTKVLLKALEQFRHIGPLRTIPPRSFHQALSPDSSRWCSGLAAWDKLSTENDDFVELVSEWLSSADRLGTGFSLIRKRYKEIESNGYLMHQLQRENLLDDLPDIIKQINDLPEIQKQLIKNDQSGVEIDPSGIAVGLTQLIPVVVDAVDRHKGITLIEQPELHNHPSVEVGLGDLFISAIRPDQKQCRFIIETHGEHLLLRMLKRIRDTTKGNVDDALQLNAGRLAIYFVEKNPADGCTAIRRIEVDINGEFIHSWPDDFFEIDFKERFD